MNSKADHVTFAYLRWLEGAIEKLSDSVELIDAKLVDMEIGPDYEKGLELGIELRIRLMNLQDIYDGLM